MNSLIVQTCYVDAKLKSNKPDEKNFSACCKHCLGTKVVCGNVNSSSNFVDHVKVSALIASYNQYQYALGT